MECSTPWPLRLYSQFAGTTIFATDYQWSGRPCPMLLTHGTTKTAVSGHDASWSEDVKNYVLEFKSFLYLKWQWLVSNNFTYLNIISGTMKVAVMHSFFINTEKCRSVNGDFGRVNRNNVKICGAWIMDIACHIRHCDASVSQNIDRYLYSGDTWSAYLGRWIF